ncbi:hypothetical protein ACH42_01660 [Endozoicomonas sp. (ex Bugula neritina AB1)]|nr:hypothetical protein ACH42_01660 [Endozoicomonas sp. (ex Bugula neritina AB1)]
MTTYRLIILLIATLLAGCALQPPTKKPNATILDNTSGQWVTPQTLPEKLAKADYVIVGELHNSHKMRDDLINTLKTLRHNNQLDALVIDALKPRSEPTTHSYLEQLNSAHSALADHFRPIVIWAEQNNVTLIGAATPKEQFNNLKTPEGQHWLKQQTKGALTADKEKELTQILENVHPTAKMPPSKSSFMLSAQQLHDYLSARTLASAGDQSVLITRAFHARKDLGVSPYLHKLKPGVSIVTLLMIEPMNGEDVSQEDINSMKKQYDYIWVQKNEPNLLIAPVDQNKPMEN